MPRLNWPYALAVLAYCAGIFYLSSQSDPPRPDLAFPHLDKIAHFFLYGGLAWVVGFGLWRSNPAMGAGLWFALSTGFAVCYGFTDEIHQLFVSERSFEWYDLLADGLGAVVAMAVFAGIQHFWPGRATAAAIPE